MQAKTVLALSMSLALGLVIVGPLVAKSQNDNKVESNIAIGMDAAGNCVVTTSPPIIRSGKRNFRVIWHVQNDCTGSRTVTVDNFKHRQDNNRRKEPVTKQRANAISAGETDDVIYRIKQDLSDADLGTYKYDILIDGQVAEDPELEIDS